MFLTTGKEDALHVSKLILFVLFWSHVFLADNGIHPHQGQIGLNLHHFLKKCTGIQILD